MSASQLSAKIPTCITMGGKIGVTAYFPNTIETEDSNGKTASFTVGDKTTHIGFVNKITPDCFLVVGKIGQLYLCDKLGVLTEQKLDVTGKKKVNQIRACTTTTIELPENKQKQLILLACGKMIVPVHVSCMKRTLKCLYSAKTIVPETGNNWISSVTKIDRGINYAAYVLACGASLHQLIARHNGEKFTFEITNLQFSLNSITTNSFIDLIIFYFKTSTLYFSSECSLFVALIQNLKEAELIHTFEKSISFLKAKDAYVYIAYGKKLICFSINSPNELQIIFESEDAITCVDLGNENIFIGTKKGITTLNYN